MSSLAKKLVNFLLEESEREMLDKFCKENSYKITDFFRTAIRIFTEHPELMQPGSASVSKEEFVTREEWQETTSKLDKLLAYQDRIVDALDYQNDQRGKPEDEEKVVFQFVAALLSYNDRHDLVTYNDVAAFLLKEFPQLKEEIEEKKLQNQAITELIQNGKVQYSVTTKKLQWK